MTTITIHPGNCGFSVTVRVKKGKGKDVLVSLDTDCEMVSEMLKDISSINRRSLLTKHINNPVYRSAAKCLKHPACPVPSGILKAAEVELGLCVPEDVTMHFEKGIK